MRESKNEKVAVIYEAVLELLEEGVDLSELKVADIAARAGIGKGTVYDYFDSKEEILGKALLHHSSVIISHLIKRLEMRQTFREKVFCCLDELQNRTKERICITKYVRMLQEQGTWKECFLKYVKREEIDKADPMRVIEYLLESAQKEKIITAQCPMSYQKIMMLSKLFAFILYVNKKDKISDCDMQEMKQYFYEGICKELA